MKVMNDMLRGWPSRADKDSLTPALNVMINKVNAFASRIRVGVLALLGPLLEAKKFDVHALARLCVVQITLSIEFLCASLSLLQTILFPGEVKGTVV